jgi:enhancing lycopene biosynthesis protein 2
MGTIRIDDALEMLATRGMAEGNGLVMEAVRDARAELEAIRKAAKDLRDTTIKPHGFDSGAYSKALSAALDLLWVIAKEEP